MLICLLFTLFWLELMSVNGQPFQSLEENITDRTEAYCNKT